MLTEFAKQYAEVRESPDTAVAVGRQIDRHRQIARSARPARPSRWRPGDSDRKAGLLQVSIRLQFTGVSTASPAQLLRDPGALQRSALGHLARPEFHASRGRQL
jgi:hypothetical protein